MPNGWNYSRARGRLRLYVLARDHYTCWLCGKPGATTIDHVIPRSLGGPDTAANLRAAHAWCNQSKHDGLPPVPITTRTW